MLRQTFVYVLIKMMKKINLIAMGILIGVVITLAITSVPALLSSEGVDYTFSERQNNSRVADITIGEHTQVIEGRNWFDTCKINGTDLRGTDCPEPTYEEFVAKRVDEVKAGLDELNEPSCEEKIEIMQTELCAENSKYSWC